MNTNTKNAPALPLKVGAVMPGRYPYYPIRMADAFPATTVAHVPIMAHGKSDDYAAYLVEAANTYSDPAALRARLSDLLAAQCPHCGSDNVISPDDPQKPWDMACNVCPARWHTLTGDMESAS